MHKELLTITSTGSIDGKEIVSYIQHISAVAVLGTGIFSELNAGLSDFFGARNSSYEKKLLDAKDYAVEELAQKAIRLGANGIVGLDVDYTTFSADIIGVAVNGTAVKFRDIVPAEEKYDYQIVNYNIELPFNLTQISVVSPENGTAVCYVSGVVFNKNVTAVSGKLRMISPFGECIFEQNTVFSVNRSDRENQVSDFKSSPIIPQFDTRSLWSSSHACFYVDKYILDNKIIEISAENYRFVNCSLEELGSIRSKYGAVAVRDETISLDTIECPCGFDSKSSENQCYRCKRGFVQCVNGHTINPSKAVTPIVVSQDKIKCPLCGKEMIMRKTCWNCSAMFVFDD